jgi:hypothetical protein
MATPKKEHSAETIKTTIAEIRAFHETGRHNLKTRSGRAQPGAGELDEHARRLDVTPHYLTRARQFADPELGYSQKELREMFAAFKRFEFALRPSTVFHLLSVKPKTVRARLQLKAIKNGWTAARLHLEIMRRFGPRTVGGRRRRVVSDAAELLTQLESECEKWGRWHAALNQAGPDGKVTLQSLPPNVRQRMSSTSRSIAALHDEVESELAKERPRRKTRGEVSSAGPAKP